ncbi:translation factor, SUA5-family protein [Flavobacteria bacterium BAL38]|nr:translation factor, SUA5-family protein [Flavobacteria bacterium BAL38]
MISTNLDQAVALLNKDQIIGFPTETVYGLAGNAFSDVAIKKIYEVKKRPSFNPLIVHIKSFDFLDTIATEIPEKAHLLANAFWPGPLTLLLKKQPTISNLVTANLDTVAVRIPNHPVALELLHQLDFPLVAPSANPFTRISPTKAEHVAQYFENEIDMVLDGGTCTAGVESTIVGFESNKVIVYRLGALSLEAIEKVVGPVTIINKNKKNPKAPGMFLKHYSPKTEFILTRNLQSEIDWFQDKKVGLLLFNTIQPNFELKNQFVLSKDSNLNEAAANLYEALHELDKLNLDLIIAERFPEYGLGITINDRLERASKN